MPPASPADVVKELTKFGLEVSIDTGRGHYKVRDPDSGAWLFDISKSPSDHNWYWALRRHLRRLGLIRKEIGELDRRSPQRRKKDKLTSGVDLDALKRAQDQAAAAGARVPLLSDLEDSPALLRRYKASGTQKGEVLPYTKLASEVAIELMSEETPRTAMSRQRLTRLLEERREQLEQNGRERAEEAGERPAGPGRGSKVEFIRLCMDVGEKRGLRVFKDHQSGQVSLKRFMDGHPVTVWVLNLFEAGMDTLEGLRWDAPGEAEKPPILAEEVKRMEEAETYGGDSAKPPTHRMVSGTLILKEPKLEPPTYGGDSTPDIRQVIEANVETENDSEFDPIDYIAGVQVAHTNGGDLKERYSELLLKLLEERVKRGSDPEPYLKRLDRLVFGEEIV